jgi:non-homologous end joining protein Ku
LKTTWNPDGYADTYREELLRRIEERAPAEVAEDPATVAPGAKVEALMEALKASVEAAKAQRPKRSNRERATRRSAS